jgi:hypothetical protein
MLLISALAATFCVITLLRHELLGGATNIVTFVMFEFALGYALAASYTVRDRTRRIRLVRTAGVGDYNISVALSNLAITAVIGIIVFYSMSHHAPFGVGLVITLVCIIYVAPTIRGRTLTARAQLVRAAGVGDYIAVGLSISVIAAVFGTIAYHAPFGVGLVITLVCITYLAATVLSATMKVCYIRIAHDCVGVIRGRYPQNKSGR